MLALDRLGGQPLKMEQFLRQIDVNPDVEGEQSIWNNKSHLGTTNLISTTIPAKCLRPRHVRLYFGGPNAGLVLSSEYESEER